MNLRPLLADGNVGDRAGNIGIIILYILAFAALAIILLLIVGGIGALVEKYDFIPFLWVTALIIIAVLGYIFDNSVLYAVAGTMAGIAIVLTIMLS